MKRKIFIGSSSEGAKVADQIRDRINSELGDWVECETWKDGGVFSLNRGTLESLVKASRKYDYGIMLASKDDVVVKRYRLFHAMRDNVLFEMGLFLGSLGLQRAFLITHDKTSLPSDFNGVTVVKYNDANIKGKIDNIIAELRKTKDSYNLKAVPSAALALGYFQSTILNFAKKNFHLNPNFHFYILIPKKIADVNAQIEKYKAKNESILTTGERPIVFQYVKEVNKYWDIPTTLQTIDNLMDYFIPPSELGINLEKEEWIQFELRNFKGTLEVLIDKHGVYKDNITIEFI
ncbi:TIR domain-containing protein [Flavobacterium coralii]|uniref:TIR domain-containing protein n=1 Tax=Flavobacterium coralii TaxID=2838017 RepID=UPI000C57B1DF|nr:hypothetical protein [Flavobacterium sp.]|tara:strand:- start:40468 stop:41340 length:873 start_codon:yes stop_codon:yes gene_type:complete